MGLRFTRVRGLLKNDQYLTLIFACHNLKRWQIGDGKVIKKVINNSIFKEFS